MGTRAAQQPTSSVQPKRLRFGRWLLVAYVLLLAASHLVRHFNPVDYLHADQTAIQVPVVPASDQSVRMPYTEYRPDGLTDPPVVMLLHGSPMASRSMLAMVPALADSFHVIVPDLPGMADPPASCPITP